MILLVAVVLTSTVGHIKETVKYFEGRSSCFAFLPVGWHVLCWVYRTENFCASKSFSPLVVEKLIIMTLNETSTRVSTSNATIAALNTTIAATTTSIGSSSMTSVLNSTITAIINSTIAPNQITPYTTCLQQFSPSTCRLAEFIRVLAYLFLAVSLIPQVVHLFNHGSRYIAGISYIWIVVRVLALTSLMVAHTFDYVSIFELIALVSTVIIFIQITIYADNLHRQQKLILVIVSLSAWLIGGGLILLLRKQVTFLLITGYALLAIHMLPQVRRMQCSSRCVESLESSRFYSIHYCERPKPSRNFRSYS